MLTSVAAYNLHPQTAGHHLTFVTILEACVRGGAAGIMLQLPPLVPALVGDLDDGAARPRLGIGDSERVGGGYVTERVRYIVTRVHVRRPLFPDTGL
jgi:hypothetical protein